jgi:outer membrane murein-binding lipoprotein Lpp
MEESILFSLDSEQQVLLASLLAIILSDKLNEDQLNILGNFVEAVGQNILLIQAIVSSDPPSTKSDSSSNTQVQDLPKSIDMLHQDLETMKAKIAALEGKQQ